MFQLFQGNFTHGTTGISVHPLFDTWETEKVRTGTQNRGIRKFGLDTDNTFIRLVFAPWFRIRIISHWFFHNNNPKSQKTTKTKKVKSKFWNFHGNRLYFLKWLESKDNVSVLELLIGGEKLHMREKWYIKSGKRKFGTSH